jgi:HSP20 family protein
MPVIRRSPAGQLASLQSDMARMMNSFLGTSPFAGPGNGSSVWLPPVDITETEEALFLAFDLPGLKEDEIQVELDDNVLTVSGERIRESELKEDDYFRYERRFGSFSRSVALPAGIKEEARTACSRFAYASRSSTSRSSSRSAAPRPRSRAREPARRIRALGEPPLPPDPSSGRSADRRYVLQSNPAAAGAGSSGLSGRPGRSSFSL